jgi:large subunit ribosomal protein L21
MFAIIESGSRQYRVEPNSLIEVNRLHLDKGATFASDKVLLVSGEDEARVGTPYVEGARVTGVILDHLRGRKVIVFKQKRRKNYRRKRGHRQELTRIRIESIELGEARPAGPGSGNDGA